MESVKEIFIALTILFGGGYASHIMIVEENLIAGQNPNLDCIEAF
ncbi:MAG: hypothetical protein ABL958_03080 [Bdellovibrionia bacterium]